MSAPFVLCMARYVRRVPWVKTDITFTCQHPRGHDGECSWLSLRESDEKAIEAERRERERETQCDDRAGTVAGLLIGIDRGDYDPHIESILAVAHERKRALRGRRTFPLVSGD